MAHLVSVVVPVYNGERFLGDALASIIEQLHRPIEIIVVDDGSTDRTANLVQEFATDRDASLQYVFQHNQGPAAARNRGLQLAAGDVIAFQDADDLWTADRLAIQFELLMRHPSAHAAIGRTRFINEETAPTEFAALADTAMSPHWFLGIHSSLYRRSAFEIVGQFNANLRYHEDIDWFRRARAGGLIILKHDDVVLLHRRHADNMTNNCAALRQGFLQMLRQSPRGHAATAESLLAWLTSGAANHFVEEPTHAHE